MLRRLAQIRAAVAGEVQDAKGADAVRAVLMRLFERFILHRGIPEQAHIELLLGTQCWIEPVISEQAVAGYDEKMRPLLRREPLGQAGNNYAEALLL